VDRRTEIEVTAGRSSSAIGYRLSVAEEFPLRLPLCLVVSPFVAGHPARQIARPGSVSMTLAHCTAILSP
jgi:hypothetical protein